MSRHNRTDAAQKATRENAGNFELALFGGHADGVGHRDHGRVPGEAFKLVSSLVTYAVRRRRAHFR